MATETNIKQRTIRIDLPLSFPDSQSDEQIDAFCVAYSEELHSFIKATFKWRDKKIKELEKLEL